MEGKIKFLNGPKGYGFIETDEEDHFFTVQDLEGGVRMQQDYLSGAREAINELEGAQCTFDSSKGDRGMKATNVKLN